VALGRIRDGAIQNVSFRETLEKRQKNRPQKWNGPLRRTFMTNRD